MSREIGDNPTMHAAPRTSSCAQVEHEAGIVHNDPPEPRRAEPYTGEIFLDLSQQFAFHGNRLALHCSRYVPYHRRSCLGSFL